MFNNIQGLWKITFQQGGGGVWPTWCMVWLCLLNKCVLLWGEGEYRFLLKLKLCPSSNHLDLRLALKEQPGQSVSTGRRKINKAQTACSPAKWSCFCWYACGSHNERSTTERWQDWREGMSASVRLEKKEHLLTLGFFFPSQTDVTELHHTRGMK